MPIQPEPTPTPGRGDRGVAVGGDNYGSISTGAIIRQGTQRGANPDDP